MGPLRKTGGPTLLDTEGWWVINDLKREGMSIKAISEATGHDRKTVRRYIQAGGIPEYKERVKRPSILDPYKDFIKERLKQDLMGTRIFHDIQKKGYTGGYWILKEFIRPLRIEKAVEAVYRYETKPGVQAQVDFDPISYIELDGELKKLYCFNYILGYSRSHYTQFTVGAKTADLIRLLMETFHFFGGYPEEILFDNMKIIVNKRTLRYEDIDWNLMFRDFFMQYDFIPRLCKPGRAQTKGKIERTGQFIRSNFFMGLEFTSLDDINGKAIGWCNKVNVLVHGTTNVIPFERMKEEKLTPVDSKPPYQIVITEHRSVSRDCFISFRGNKYSIPWKNAGREAKLLIRETKMDIEIGGENVCLHEIVPGTHRLVKVKEHFAGLYKEIWHRNRNEHVRRIEGYSNGNSPVLLQNRQGEDVQVQKRDLAVYDVLTERRDAA
jgi:transposase